MHDEQCSPGTSSSEPLWYDDSPRTYTAVSHRTEGAPSPPSNERYPRSSKRVVRFHRETEDFGLSAARIRIENRFSQQQMQSQETALHSAASEPEVVEIWYQSDSEGRRRKNDNEDVRKLKLNRTKKDRLKGEWR